MSTANNDFATAVEKGGKNNNTGGSNGTGNVLTNDIGTGTKTVTAVHLGDVEGQGTAGVIGSALTGLYGSLNLRANGNYTYVIDQKNPTVQALKPGETLSESFNYTMSSTSGPDTAVLTVTINGANDAPVAVNDSVTVAKAVGLATGNIVANDTDVDNSVSDFRVTKVQLGATEGSGTSATFDASTGTYTLAGTYGTLSVNSDGTYSYQVNQANARVAALGAGGTLTDNFNYTMSDGSLTDPGRIIIKITGSAVVNTPPVAVDDTGTAVEKGGVSNSAGGSDATGNVRDNDSDAQIGAAGLSVTEVRTGGVEGSGTAGSLGLALKGEHGSLILNANGSYRYIVDNADPAVEKLNVGQTLTDKFNYTITDGSLTDKAVLTITINGANDAPVGVNDTATVSGSGAPGTGNVLTNDQDDSAVLTVNEVRVGATEGSGATGTVGAALAGTYGSLTLKADGSYTYTANPANAAVAALAPGQTLTDSFNYRVSDGTYTDRAVLAVTVTGPGVVIDGALGDWKPEQRLDGGEVAGYKLYGDTQKGSFVFGLDAGTATIGPNTTIWLDTDLNSKTGFQIFGYAGGAEYSIEIDADGVARLYSGAAGGTPVGTVTYAIAPDGHTAEFSVSGASMGSPTAANVLADVNNSAFLPADYSQGGYRIGSLPVTTVGTVKIDGSVDDWTGIQQVNTAADSPAGTHLYDQVQNGTFLFALSDENEKIGAHTTIWLNTDRDAATGYQIFGNTGGAEYNIDIGTDGTPRLYTGGAGETFVANLAYNYSADHKTIEIALPTGLMSGSPIGANVLVDINDHAFLSNDYANLSYSIGRYAPPVPINPTERIAIVYSETSAANYFSPTAYGQLFMSAQNQAMQAGMPFDLLTENDLKDPTKLAGYDAIVFPDMQNVKAADLTAITNSLLAASRDYGIGLIAAGNFMTNDENGNAFAGDSYARMKSLLGVTLDSFGSTDALELHADSGTNPILKGFTTGESIGTYTNIAPNQIGYQSFHDVSGNGQTLFDENAGGANRPAVIANTTGGRNVHFASDAIIGNNNILQHAIDWVAGNTVGTTVDVSLELTRMSGLFASRTDMDQSQELFDVVDTHPSIYDKLIPIVAQWHKDFNFAGSFYVNIGDNPAESQGTNWSVSRPYYQQLMALGNEIGTHSYTHPENTNTTLFPTVPTITTKMLTPAEESANAHLQALLAQVDPTKPGAVDPSTLSQADRDLLASSYKFQFLYSAEILSQQLGIPLASIGGAVPGMPETVDASHSMLQYLSYLSGGYSGIGAGFPGAFGFLTPSDSKVYLAPNMTFDFTEIGFQQKTPEQAAADWAAQFAASTAHGNVPIVSFPWHDYGPTDWNLGDPNHLTYTTQMFTSVLQGAYNAGMEFVTGADLAQRVEDFDKSNFTVTQNGNTISVALSSPDAGKFALSFGDGSSAIASATLGGSGYYAWNGDKLLLPAGGGNFTVTLGTPSDVTHLAALPMRAELTGVTGNGTNLGFDFTGSGDATVALKTQGTSSVIATGADSGSVAAGKLTLGFASDGAHHAAVTYGAGGNVVGTAGNEVILGGTGADTISTGGGTDHVFGGAGADTFLFGHGSGTEFVGDFLSGIDHLDLVGLGYSTAAQALAAFTPSSDGLTLALAGDTLHLVGIGAGGLSANDILVDHLVA